MTNRTIVAGNMFGDIVSDGFAGLIRRLGFACSAQLNPYSNDRVGPFYILIIQRLFFLRIILASGMAGLVRLKFVKRTFKYMGP